MGIVAENEKYVIHEDLIKKVEAELPGEEELFDLAELFKIFGDTTRIRILSVLSQTELCVYDIAEALSMSTSAVSHQLKILRQARLIRNRREGKQMFYSLADDHVRTIIATGLEHLEE